MCGLVAMATGNNMTMASMVDDMTTVLEEDPASESPSSLSPYVILIIIGPVRFFIVQ